MSDKNKPAKTAKGTETGLITKSTAAEGLAQIEAALEMFKKKMDNPMYKAVDTVDGITISKENDVQKLVKLYAMCTANEETYEKAQKDLKLIKRHVKPFTTEEGHKLSDVKGAIQQRIEIITNESAVKKLKEAQDKLKKFLTEDDQVADILGSIASFTTEDE